MGKIHILGLGPGDVNYLTLGVIEKLKKGYRNYLKTKNHPVVKYLKDNNIAYKSYDHVYEEEEDILAAYEYIVDDLIRKARRYGQINYLVPGSPLIAEKTVEILLGQDVLDIEVEILPGLGFIEAAVEATNRGPIDGLRVVEGVGFKFKDIDINLDTIITQVHNRSNASYIKQVLTQVYGDKYEIYIVDGSGIKDGVQILSISICELDKIEDIGPLTSIYIPKVDKIDKKIYSIADIIDTMQILRSDIGCSWDRRQTHKSIRDCVIEEAYEVVDAIDREDVDGLIEELGDVLLQVIFHSQIAMESRKFNLYDITTELNSKLIYRHNHIFNNKKVESSDEVVYNWDKMKYKDRDISTYTDYLKDVPKLPSLMRSFKIQDRASKIGFDWDDIRGALEKVMEEYGEVLESIDNTKGGGVNRVEEELGDLLFAIVNVSRFLKINPEVALNKTISKFIDRFQFMEERSVQIGKKLEDMTLEEMDLLWDEAKKHSGQQ
ncbi:MAG TPA: nucleoside triphosphate pyrophosphohydrolase [Tepidimicrobium sp.]|nr:nucleoside triphosphate pyrophosphohydrolase [Tepidimicrobium sp.]